ncbi:MAG: DUF192 domain-containing protein [Firmicutes bacterium]|nr:DUF192 domain-containing protein [Bacillota bacterium]
MADSFLTRLVGLLGTSHLNPGEGLLLTGCNGIHSLGMKFAFDVVFLAADGTVLRSVRNIRPNRLGPVVWRAKYALELPLNTAQVAVGERLAWEVVN